MKWRTLMIMWGFGVYLMRLADYLYGRRDRKKCDVCGKKFDNVDDMEMHRKDLHQHAVMN